MACTSARSSGASASGLPAVLSSTRRKGCGHCERGTTISGWGTRSSACVGTSPITPPPPHPPPPPPPSPPTRPPPPPPPPTPSPPHPRLPPLPCPAPPPPPPPSG